MNSTPEELAVVIARYERRVAYIRSTEIPFAYASAEESRKCGRYARATDYVRLAWDCAEEARQLEHFINQLRRSFPARDELCHSPAAPEGSRSEGLT